MTESSRVDKDMEINVFLSPFRLIIVELLKLIGMKLAMFLYVTLASQRPSVTVT